MIFFAHAKPLNLSPRTCLPEPSLLSFLSSNVQHRINQKKTIMSFTSSQSSLLVALGIVLPHLALAHYLGVVPEPAFSLLLLSSLSLFTLFYLKPVLLELLIPSTPNGAKDLETRGYASHIAANVQWISFVVIWDGVLSKQWPCPSGTTQGAHAREVESWQLGHGPVAWCVWIGINGTCFFS